MKKKNYLTDRRLKSANTPSDFDWTEDSSRSTQIFEISSLSNNDSESSCRNRSGNKSSKSVKKGPAEQSDISNVFVEPTSTRLRKRIKHDDPKENKKPILKEKSKSKLNNSERRLTEKFDEKKDDEQQSFVIKAYCPPIISTESISQPPEDNRLSDIDEGVTDDNRDSIINIENPSQSSSILPLKDLSQSLTVMASIKSKALPPRVYRRCSNVSPLVDDSNRVLECQLGSRKSTVVFPSLIESEAVANNQSLVNETVDSLKSNSKSKSYKKKTKKRKNRKIRKINSNKSGTSGSNQTTSKSTANDDTTRSMCKSVTIETTNNTLICPEHPYLSTSILNEASKSSTQDLTQSLNKSVTVTESNTIDLGNKLVSVMETELKQQNVIHSLNQSQSIIENEKPQHDIESQYQSASVVSEVNQSILRNSNLSLDKSSTNNKSNIESRYRSESHIDISIPNNRTFSLNKSTSSTAKNATLIDNEYNKSIQMDHEQIKSFNNTMIISNDESTSVNISGPRSDYSSINDHNASTNQSSQNKNQSIINQTYINSYNNDKSSQSITDSAPTKIYEIDIGNDQSVERIEHNINRPDIVGFRVDDSTIVDQSEGAASVSETIETPTTVGTKGKARFSVLDLTDRPSSVYPQTPYSDETSIINNSIIDATDQCNRSDRQSINNHNESLGNIRQSINIRENSPPQSSSTHHRSTYFIPINDMNDSSCLDQDHSSSRVKNKSRSRRCNESKLSKTNQSKSILNFEESIFSTNKIKENEMIVNYDKSVDSTIKSNKSNAIVNYDKSVDSTIKSNKSNAIVNYDKSVDSTIKSNKSNAIVNYKESVDTTIKSNKSNSNVNYSESVDNRITSHITKSVSKLDYSKDDSISKFDKTESNNDFDNPLCGLKIADQLICSVNETPLKSILKKKTDLTSNKQSPQTLVGLVPYSSHSISANQYTLRQSHPIDHFDNNSSPIIDNAPTNNQVIVVAPGISNTKNAPLKNRATQTSFHQLKTVKILNQSIIDKNIDNQSTNSSKHESQININSDHGEDNHIVVDESGDNVNIRNNTDNYFESTRIRPPKSTDCKRHKPPNLSISSIRLDPSNAATTKLKQSIREPIKEAENIENYEQGYGEEIFEAEEEEDEEENDEEEDDEEEDEEEEDEEEDDEDIEDDEDGELSDSSDLNAKMSQIKKNLPIIEENEIEESEITSSFRQQDDIISDPEIINDVSESLSRHETLNNNKTVSKIPSLIPTKSVSQTNEDIDFLISPIKADPNDDFRLNDSCCLGFSTFIHENQLQNLSFLSPLAPDITTSGIEFRPGKRTLAKARRDPYSKVVYKNGKIDHFEIDPSPKTIKQRQINARKFADSQKLQEIFEKEKRLKRLKAGKYPQSPDGISVEYRNPVTRKIEKKNVILSADEYISCNSVKLNKLMISKNDIYIPTESLQSESIIEIFPIRSKIVSITVVIDNCQISCPSDKKIIIPKGVPYFIYNPNNQSVYATQLVFKP